MPRAPGLGKRHPGPAGQRDTRHENGLVGPAAPKRSSAKKNASASGGCNAAAAAAPPADPASTAASAAAAAPGNGHTNNPNDNQTASPSRHPRSNPASPLRKGNAAASAASANIAQPFANGNASPKQNGAAHAVDQHHVSGFVNGSSSAASMRPGSSDHTYTDETSSESGFPVAGRAAAYLDAGHHRQIDVNAMKNLDVHRDSGPLELAATVLKALPMQDTLAILIILMQVPAVSLTFIYTIFAFLTFVPPVTTSSGMNINFAEMIDGMSTATAPLTLLSMDILFVLFWLFLWQPMQEVMLDMAKPVIAITLGGGTGSRDGTSRGLTTCFIWVLLHHLIRGTRSHWGHLVSLVPDTWPIPSFLHDPFRPHAHEFEVKGLVAWTRSLLAVHILTQGVIRHIKEWYLRREKVNANVNLGDPEAGKLASGGSSGVGSGSGSGSGNGAAGSSSGGHPAVDGGAGDNMSLSTADGDVAGGSQGHAALSASKKKRKQSTQVRLQQPLWAALASTKIVVMKEYELSHTSREQTGSNATDVHNLGNAPFERQPRQVWISYVGSDEVCFSTSFFPEDMDQETTSGGGGDTMPTATRKHPEKPFFVRVNNAFWQPTRMFPLEAPVEEMEEEQRGTRWTGDIYGLRPGSKYVVEFVHRQTDDVLFKTSIRTVHEPLRQDETAATAAVAADQPPLRPDSPATTLRTSIAAADARLADEKNRLKAARKEWKTRINNLKKELELADHQLSSAGNGDEKLRQKIRQQETQRSQAERDTASHVETLRKTDSGAELAERKKRVERLYASDKKQYDKEKRDFDDYRARLDKEVKAREVEESNLVTRLNKLRTRINKVETELANITDANNRGFDEAERHRRERANWQDHMSAIETNYRERLMQARATNGGKLEQIRALEAQMGALVGAPVSAAAIAAAAAAANAVNVNEQPAGAWNPNPAAPPHVPGTMWNAPGGAPGTWPAAAPFEPGRPVTRGRSSSMLSDISGFTQSSDGQGGQAAGGHAGYNPWMQFSGQHSSGSGSGSAPRSPV